MSAEGSGIRLQDIRLRVKGCAPVRKLLLGHPSDNRAISWYFCTRSATKKVRDVLGGRTIPKTRKTGLFWTQKLLSACFGGSQTNHLAGARKFTKMAECENLGSAPDHDTCSRYLELENPTVVNQFEPLPHSQTCTGRVNTCEPPCREVAEPTNYGRVSQPMIDYWW